MIDPTYIEAILEWREPGGEEQVRGWLGEHGLKTMPMKRGLLITGDKRTFEAAFSTDLEGRTPPIPLEVPAQLGEAVSSITIPRPRQIVA